jgi:hypothetical protein
VSSSDVKFGCLNFPPRERAGLVNVVNTLDDVLSERSCSWLLFKFFFLNLTSSDQHQTTIFVTNIEQHQHCLSCTNNISANKQLHTIITMSSFSLSSLSLGNGLNSTSASTSTPALDLTFFPQLPLEVRSLIWCMAAMEPEIISVSARSIIPERFRLWTLFILTWETRLKFEDAFENHLPSSCKYQAEHTQASR